MAYVRSGNTKVNPNLERLDDIEKYLNEVPTNETGPLDERPRWDIIFLMQIMAVNKALTAGDLLAAERAIRVLQALVHPYLVNPKGHNHDTNIAGIRACLSDLQSKAGAITRGVHEQDAQQILPAIWSETIVARYEIIF